ncbi:hypothetical protein NEOLEDRAFT_670129 [Neolentinus lepideus HHB14362 ss-1]|uniref:Uncharacterized protein n=1 Tax=Neolentinus lepideus HHB14362 ss-1 TaxID=1314782 RepID=A0A165QEM1_9AGAM|nr:hypothetical protein NEOLEDRAFT_670129 [Neolentinus lepideus HHB14362 ss-1]
MRSFDTSARESGDDRISDPVSTPCILSRYSYQTIRTLLRRGCHFYVAQSKAVCAGASFLDAGEDCESKSSRYVFVAMLDGSNYACECSRVTIYKRISTEKAIPYLSLLTVVILRAKNLLICLDCHAPVDNQSQNARNFDASTFVSLDPCKRRHTSSDSGPPAKPTPSLTSYPSADVPPRLS